MDSIIMQRKNKQNITKINSIINQYEAKLDQRVNQVINEMMHYTKKVTDPLELPILRDTKTQSQKLVEKQIVKRGRNKSTSQHAQLSFLTDTSLQAEVSQLKNTFKQVDSSKVIYDTGRPIGNKTIARPKFAKKKPDILPRQLRLNPLHQRNAIKAYQLDKGLLSLIEKGKIGKDVNIITAFQKGRPVLQTQKAIFHQGQERFAQLEVSQMPEPSPIRNNSKKVPIKIQNKDKEMNVKQQSYDENWALTMPKDGQSSSKNNNFSSSQLIKGISEKSKALSLNLESHLYIKIVHYQYQRDKSFSQIMIKHLTYRGEIMQIVRQIQKLMKIYNIQIGYVDISKVLEYVAKLRKLNKSQLMNCLVGCNQNRSTSLKNVKGIKQKYLLSLDKVISSLKCRIERKMFLKYMQKKRVANKLIGWAVSRLFVKKHTQMIKTQRIKLNQKYDELQKKFKQNFVKIQQERHYQIHLVNEQLRGKQNYKQILNIQLTKIFNIKNMNKYIIYILPYSLDDETINYYYKIMELQEIPNYKQRVNFLTVDPNKYFSQEISLSSKLYYNSHTLKKLKKKVKDFPAYFVVSYPTLVNVKLAEYLKIPILSGNLNLTLQIEKRTNLEQFNIQVVQGINIKHSQFPNLTTLSDHITQYCKSNKRISKYVLKINGKHKSSGIALLTTPFSSLPQMYQKTTLIIENQTIDGFYHNLLKQGGVIQKYQEGSSFVSAVMQIDSDDNINVVGTFQKISSGFVNIGYIFPQKKVDHKLLCTHSKEICQKLSSSGHFGSVEITFILTQLNDLYLQKVRCYSTHLQSSLYYYKFLSEGSFDEKGDYLAKIVDTFEQDGKEEEVVTQQARSFCFIPFLIHFGLSQRQVNSFFQLCRMGGVSFDLQNKYGATFILLGNLKSCMGLITTAKDKRGAIKLLLKSLDFLVKQNSHNMSNQTLAQKEQKMKERQNVVNIKDRLQQI